MKRFRRGPNAEDSQSENDAFDGSVDNIVQVSQVSYVKSSRGHSGNQWL